MVEIGKPDAADCTLQELHGDFCVGLESEMACYKSFSENDKKNRIMDELPVAWQETEMQKDVSIRVSLQWLLDAFLIICFASALPVSAQCVNSSTPSCNVYSSCFAKECDCAERPSEYFLNYGKRYCEIFLDLPDLSTKGKLWRDSTLRCLQEKIVPILPRADKGESCDCDKMQTVAYDSHVACYTQSNASICDLPATDWAKIVSAVDPVKSLTDSKGRKQMLEVANICLPVLIDDARKHAIKLIEILE